jgi:hypothetical protein
MRCNSRTRKRGMVRALAKDASGVQARPLSRVCDTTVAEFGADAGEHSEQTAGEHGWSE